MQNSKRMGIAALSDTPKTPLILYNIPSGLWDGGNVVKAYSINTGYFAS